MLEFPTLRTGAVIQYPASRAVAYSTAVLRFVGGKEQRFSESGSGLRKWIIPLSLLTEDELATIEDFIATSLGRFGTFTFSDPWDGTQYENCTLDADENTVEHSALSRGRAILVLREGRP